MRTTPWPFQSAETREHLRILGAYLAYQVDVYQPSTGRYGQLRGLPFTHAGERPVAHVHWHLSKQAQDASTAAEDDANAPLLPVLYGFEDLATEIKLPDGRRIVAAVELSNMVRLEAGFMSPAKTASLYGDEGNRWVFTSSALGTTLSEFSEECLLKGKLAGRIEQALREWHFAVELRPEQYQRRTIV